MLYSLILFSGFLNIVLSSEALDAAGGIYQLLLAGEEGMAGGANLNLYILDGRTGLYYIPAGAANFSRFILGMNLRFHNKSSMVQVQLRRQKR